MQKIAIIGPGSMDFATELGELHPEYIFIGLADSDAVVVEAPIHPIHTHEPIALSHSFDFAYNPTPEEDKWLREQMALGERFEILPIRLPEDGLGCSISYWWSSGKENWRAQQPRHRSQFTKSQPSAKTRKAARRRAKAGRKAAR